MKQAGTLILDGGGIRSLIAVAQTLRARPDQTVALLYIRDGREACEARRRHVLAHAEYHRIARVLVLDAPWLASRPWSKHGTSTLRDPVATGVHAPGLLRRAHLAMTALTVAAELRSSQVIWPVQAAAGDGTGTGAGANDDDNNAAATRLTEQAQLLAQTATLEAPHTPGLSMPLLQLSDAQLISLGAQLGVPWSLAWSCRRDQERPCGRCPACLRRAQAFGEAGIEDLERRPAAKNVTKTTVQTAVSPGFTRAGQVRPSGRAAVRPDIRTRPATRTATHMP